MTPSETPVVILCGGKGTRLREETEHKPKPLVQVGGRPILWHIMKHYAVHGFRRFVLCLGYRGDLIREYFLRYRLFNSTFTIHLGAGGDRLELHDAPTDDWSVTLVETGSETMTGARVHQALAHCPGDRFLLTYGDGVSNVDLGALIAFHEAHGRLGTVTGVRPRSRFGELMLDGARIVEFNEKPEAHHGRINGGFFVFERGFSRYLSADPGCVMEQAPLARMAADGQLMVFEHDGYWQCMDTYRDYEALNAEWAAGRPGWRTW